MDVLRRVDAYCEQCAQPRKHVVHREDPGRATCATCGATQPLMVPLDPADGEP